MKTDDTKNTKRSEKMEKTVARRGIIAKILIPRAGVRYFKTINAVLDRMLVGRKLKNANKSEVFIPRADGTHIRACVYTRENAENAGESVDKGTASVPVREAENENRPIMLWLHGGGYAMGSPEQEFYFVKRILAAIDCVVVSPEYTRSMDAPYPKALEDCYTSLKWVKENAVKLGADPSRIFVGGDSAGGGLCAAVCLYARDKGEVQVAYQMPLYPMIDDRPTASNQNNHTACWDTQSNEEGWKAYLGDLYGKKDVPYYAAPARATDLSGLPPALTYVGTIEPFYAETVDYVNRMRAAGVPVDFRIYEGCFHGFDVLCPKSKPGADARAFFRDGLIYAAKNYRAEQK